MKPEDIYKLRTVSDPRLSPDGSRVAFVVTQADEESNDYRSSIWIVPSDGSAEPSRFTWSDKRDIAPRWSPDGRWLAFASSRDGKAPQLYIAPLDGGEPRKVTDHPEGVGAAVWSPDSRRIAHVSTVRGPAWDEEDEGKRRPRVITTVGYKADGKGFVQDRFAHVFVVDVDGSAEPRQLTDGDFDHGDVTWSPDGTTLALTANRDDDRTTHQDLWLLAVDGDGELRRLTASDAMYAKPSWSPDGTTIAARIYPNVDTAPWNSQIVLIDPASGDVRDMTSHLDRQCGPYFAPREPIWNDRRLLFPVDAAGNTHLFAMDSPEGKPEPLFEGDLVVSDHDAIGDVLVHVKTTATQPTELFNGDKQLTRFNEPFVGDVAIASPERFVAGDVEAWVMRPASEPRGTLLFIHGGPFTQYGNTFFDEFQVAVGAGYALLYANPRGSSGYGDDWGRAIRGPISGGPGWGTVDFDDLMAVVDTATERFDFVDPERLGVLGGSYGGFMTAWITTKTDRFKAACAERGIYNVMSSIGTSDGLWSSDSVWGGNPYDHAELMTNASPITYAENITTPLLLLHSEQDHRCPVEQAEQMFTRLRLLGREVEFVRFPHGTHDLSRGGPPRQRVFRFETILDWFNRYL